jgi:tRNA 2-thiouridine synthesizing protein A
MTIDAELDASGLACPMPLLKAKQVLRELDDGKLLRVVSTDPNSQADFIAFSQLTKHRLLGMYRLASRYYFILRA